MQTLSKEFFPMLLEGEGGAGGGDQTETGDPKGKDEGDNENPLAPDLRKWKQRARDAEEALEQRQAKEADEKREAELKAAKDKKELDEVIARHQAESAARERKLEVRAAAAEAGVPPEFAAAADDGEAPIEDVIKAANERWIGALDDHKKRETTNSHGGGSSPESGGEKKFRRSQISDPKFYRENRAEIIAASKDGRIIEDM